MSLWKRKQRVGGADDTQYIRIDRSMERWQSNALINQLIRPLPPDEQTVVTPSQFSEHEDLASPHYIPWLELQFICCIHISRPLQTLNHRNMLQGDGDAEVISFVLLVSLLIIPALIFRVLLVSLHTAGMLMNLFVAAVTLDKSHKESQIWSGFS